MSISSPFPYTFKEPTDSITCVYKLWFGSKYFIFKGLKLYQSVEGLSVQIHRERNHPKEDSILFKVIAYINKSRVTNMTVEVVHESDNPVELLEVEYEQLQKAKKDLNCLNTRFVNNDYYPKWIPQTAINEFNKRLQGIKAPDKHKVLRRFLVKHVKDPNSIDKVVEYITTRFK